MGHETNYKNKVILGFTTLILSGKYMKSLIHGMNYESNSQVRKVNAQRKNNDGV